MNLDNAKNWATIISLIIAAVALMISAVTSFMTFWNRKRELAVNLIYELAKDADWVTRLALELAKPEHSSFVNKIIEKEPTSIPGGFYDSVVIILKIRENESKLPVPPAGDPSVFHITKTQSEIIRFLWVNWLNRLEGVLASWIHGAANRDIMERVYGPLILIAEPELSALKKLRENCPFIGEFRRKIRKKARLSDVLS